MLKLVLVLVIFWLVYRAGRNLLRAAMKDDLVSGENWGQQSGTTEGTSQPGDRRRSGEARHIEDAVWKDLP